MCTFFIVCVRQCPTDMRLLEAQETHHHQQSNRCLGCRRQRLIFTLGGGLLGFKSLRVTGIVQIHVYRSELYPFRQGRPVKNYPNTPMGSKPPGGHNAMSGMDSGNDYACVWCHVTTTSLIPSKRIVVNGMGDIDTTSFDDVAPSQVLDRSLLFSRIRREE